MISFLPRPSGTSFQYQHAVMVQPHRAPCEHAQNVALPLQDWTPGTALESDCQIHGTLSALTKRRVLFFQT